MLSGDRSSGSRVAAVLGATGCVGRQVSAAFAREGYDVVGVARHHAPHASSHKFVPLDIAVASAREIADLFDSQQVDVVVNATGGWVLTAEAMDYAHVRLVDRLLAATAVMSQRPRVVQVGSIHEYGFVPFGVPIDESITPNPTTPYARTKFAGSSAILDATRAGDVDGVVLRSVNLCGPHTTEASFLGAVLAKLRDVRPGGRLELTIADAVRDYIDVRDVAEAVVKAAETPAVGRVVNIGRGEALTMRELVTLLVAVAGFPPDVIEEQDAHVESKGGGWTQADIQLADRLLGWRPEIGLRDSLRDMWETAG